MKIGSLLKLQARLLRRRNKAQRDYRATYPGTLDYTRIRLDAEVVTLDKVLDDLDRLIKNNHDRFHDRSRK